MILPLALAQFIASYAATNMNVAISAIAKDLGTSVAGVQTAITLFTLTMAALMIPGSKLTDIWGRKRCFIIGLIVYGVGGLLAALSTGLPMLIIGYSLLEGVGSALLIPPIYILITVAFPDIKSRARYFGVVSGAAGLGAAAGPLIGGLVTSALSWRASFGLQVLVVAWIAWLALKITDPATAGPRPRFDVAGAVLSAAGLFFVVLGLLQSRTFGFGASRQDWTIGGTVVLSTGSLSPVWIYVAIGAVFLAWFFLHIRSAERKGRAVLVAMRMFRNKAANLGLGTQVIQWLVMQGSFFVVSVYLQEVNHYSAIKTGLVLTPSTIGILAASAAAERFARRHSQRWLIIMGFLISAAGTILLLTLVRAHSPFWTWVPGLLLTGIGVGTMLTSSVNVVQSSFPDKDQGEISGLSRCVSNLGSSLGTALAGSVLVAVKMPAGRPFAAALIVMLVFTGIGLLLAFLLPRPAAKAAAPASADSAAVALPLLADGEQVILPGRQVHEQPVGGQFAPGPVELGVPQQIPQAPASPGQARPVELDPARRRRGGEVDHDEMPLGAVGRLCRPRPREQVPAGVVVRPASDVEQPPTARSDPAVTDGR
jgi:MFS family permease